MGIPDRFVDGVPKHARLAQFIGKLERVLYSVAYFLLLTLLTVCNAQGADRSTNTSVSLLVTPAAPTATLTPQTTKRIFFTTPPPVRAEESLTDANRNVPSVFTGVVNYAPVQATLSAIDLPLPPVTTLAEAALAVVQIRRCDDFGCTTPGGSGVIIHPSGLILTAYHVLQTDPDDPTSPRYPDFVIAVTANTRDAPQTRYRARLVAEKAEQDLALLLIDRDEAGTVLAPGQIELPALPLADVTNLFGGVLNILGYPVMGGEAISRVDANFSSFDDNGRLIVVDRALNSGNSGGPALVEQAGHFAIAGIVIRRRSTQGQLSQEGLLRAIDQMDTLTWTPKMVRAWGEAVQANAQAGSEGDLLRLTLTLNTIDLRAQPLRLFFYATDAATGQPWQPANTSAPLVVWADVPPPQVIERRALTLTVPVTSLGAMPNRLRFSALLWDTAQGNPLWADASGVQAAPDVVALVPITTPTMVPTFTPNPTVTPQPMATPTATSTNLPNTPTATPTVVPTPTLTATQNPTATPQPTVTPSATQVPAVDIEATQTAAANEQIIATALANLPEPTVTPQPPSTATATHDSMDAKATAAVQTIEAVLNATPTPTTPISTITPTPTPTNLAHVLQQGLNFRAGPGTGYTVISSLPEGTALLVIGQSEDGYWLNVQLSDGGAGWVARPYTDFNGTGPISPVPPTPLAASTPQPVSPDQAAATAAIQTIEAVLNGAPTPSATPNKEGTATAQAAGVQTAVAATLTARP